LNRRPESVPTEARLEGAAEPKQKQFRAVLGQQDRGGLGLKTARKEGCFGCRKTGAGVDRNSK